MAGQEETSNFSKRLAKLVSVFEDEGRQGSEPHDKRFGRIFLDDLRGLFTRDITRKGLSDLIRRDARETLRFYTRAVDFESTRTLPWYQRYPQSAWKVFVALAYRLSPPRRLVFALAIFLGAVGWIEFLLFLSRTGDEGSSGAIWMAISSAVIVMLLFMELRDKLDLKGDLEIAREIQFGLVPSEPYAEGDLTMWHAMRPANTVGGDYYDIIKLDDDRVGIVIGDVSGKGMPAALLMALLLGSLRTLVSAGLRGTELITRLNEYLCATIPPGRLVTLFYGEIALATGTLAYVNAGHCPPYLIRRGQPLERLDATCMVLGFLPGSLIQCHQTQLGPGDGLLLFTDGITEAFNSREQEYGESRLAEFLLSRQGAAPSVLVSSLIEAVVAFCDPERPSDDMTVMSISRR